MRKYNRITIKIGSNVLARKDGTLDVTRVSALVDQISQLRSHDIEVILVSSGAVACGRAELKHHDTRRLDDVERRQLFSAVGQVKLINKYAELFRDYGIEVGQVLTMKENFSTRTHYLNQRSCMLVMVENGILPIVNENDTVSLTELMFTDNDELSGLVASMLDCDALLILSNIDGIYDGDPAESSSSVVREVDIDTDLSRYIRVERSGFGRGGMATKYNVARKVAGEGIEVIIANGKRENILTDIVLGNSDGIQQPFTRFKPRKEETSGLKRWIAHSDSFAKGRIVIDDNAVSAITSDRAVSLLPVGVIDVSGQFEKDDLINIYSVSGQRIAIGRTAYSSVEILEYMGCHDMRPVIHYDYLYIL